MSTSQINSPCSLCEKTPDVLCDEKIVYEFVVVDYRQKSAHHIGFPSGETHVVQGWKIKPSRSIHTYICDDCSSKYLGNRKLHAPRNSIIAAAIFLVLLGLMIYLAIIEEGNEYGGIGLALIALSGFSLFAFFVYISRVFAHKSDSFRDLHKKAFKKVMGGTIRLNLSQPELFPKGKGMRLYIADKEWETLSVRLKEVEEKTGWSYIHYVREFFGGPQICTLEQGAAYKKVNHLGLYLGEPEKEEIG